MEFLREVLLVEDADHGVLAVDGGHDAHAEVDGPAPHLELEATVLGLALLGDVQLGHDLDAADDGGGEAPVDGLGGGIQAAVDAVLDLETGGHGLQVDVGGAPLERVEDGGVHQPDDGGLVLVREALQVQHLVVPVLLVEHLDLEGLPGLVHDLLAALGLLEHLLDLGQGGTGEAEGPLQAQPEHVLGGDVQGVGHGQPEDAVPLLHRHEVVLEHQIQRQSLEQGEIHRFPREVQGRVELLGGPESGQGLIARGDGIRRTRGV